MPAATAGTLKARYATMRIDETNPALWSSGARVVSERKAPANAGPNPRPAVAAPARNRAVDPKCRAASVTAIPAIRATSPQRAVARACDWGSQTDAIALMPAMTKIGRPPATWLVSPSTPAVSDGPSERTRPPSAQVATRHGIAAMNGVRSAPGTATLGLIARVHEPSPRTVSGTTIAIPTWRPTPRSSSQKTSRVGSGANWTRRPDPRAPVARPVSGRATPSSAPTLG